MDQKLRIAILSDRIPPESIGGAGRVTWSLTVGLSDSGHEVHVIAATREPSFDEMRESIPTHHLHSRYPDRLRNYWALYNPQTIPPLKRLLRDIKPDVVNAHNIHSDLSYYSLSLAHQLNLPVIFSSHDVMPFAYAKLTHFINPQKCGVESAMDYRLPLFYNLMQMRFRYNPLRNIMIRRILTANTHMRIAASKAHQDALEANGLPPFKVVHNGLDPADYEGSSATVDALRIRLGLEGRKVIVFGGRISGLKGYIETLRALNEVAARVPEATLLILSRSGVGFEEDLPKYPHLTRANIREGGYLSGAELSAAYRLADCVILPSICFETFGMMNLEAMAASRPVITTCLGGPPEVVIDGETGYVINPFDTAQFADRLVKLLTNPVLRERMGAAGRARLIERFTLARFVGQMVGIYREAIGLASRKTS